MIKTFKSVITSLLLISTTAVFGQGLSEQDRAVVDKQRNILSNPGFEGSKVNWTNSGATFSIVTSGSNLLIGKASATWDPSSSSQTLESSLATIPNGLYGQSCLAKIKYLGGGSNITFAVHDGTNNIASQALSAVTTPTDVELSFICPSSGSARIRLVSSGNEAIMALDETYIGQNYRVGTVAQATFYGGLKWANVSGCVWTGASGGAWGDFSADADCTTPSGSNLYGAAVAPSTKIPGITFNNLPPGEYYVVATATLVAGGADSTRCWFRLSDGTQSSPHQVQQGHPTVGYKATGPFTHRFKYDTTQSSVTIRVQNYRESGSNTCNVDAQAGGASSEVEFLVYKFPSQSETVFAPNMQAAYGGARWAYNASGIHVISGGSTWTTFTDTDFNTAKTLVGNAVSCATTGDICFKIAKVPSGKYLLTFSGGGGSTSGTGSYRIGDGTNFTSVNTVSTNYLVPSLSMVLDYTSEQTNKEFVLQGYSDATNTTFRIDQVNPTTVQFNLIPIEQNIPMPVIVNSVQTGYSGQMKIAAAIVAGGSITSACTSNPCTLYKNYDGGISSVGRGGTGSYTINFTSGYFSDTPICQVTNDSAAIRLTTFGSWNSTTVYVNGLSSGFADEDQKFTITCIGPR